jgi:hypothetical protein
MDALVIRQAHRLPARRSCCHEHRPHRTTFLEASPTTGSVAEVAPQLLLR